MNYDPMMREKILSFIRANGPVLPVQVSKQFGGNLLFSGAILSELVGKKAVKISAAKIGGSPVYYTEGQETKLEVLYSHLKDVHRKVFDLLKEERVLKDSELDPWQRVALRELKDFADPIEKNDGIYWKWHLTSNEGALALIESKFKTAEKVQEEQPPRVLEIQQPPKLDIPEIKQELQKTMQESLPNKEVHVEEKKIRVKKDINLDITNYFSEKGANVVEERVVRKNSEIEYVINIPSNVGQVKFFVKVRNKKVISDADIVLAHNDAQLRKLPLLFLSPGELNKKAEDYTSKNFVIFEKI